MDPYKNGFFPRYIDRPRLIGVFEMDEFIVAFGVVFAMIFGSLAAPDLDSAIVMPVSIVAGGVAAIIYAKFKKNNPNGYLMQVLYKKGIWHPEESPTKLLSHPELKDLRCVPYGFNKVLES